MEKKDTAKSKPRGWKGSVWWSKAWLSALEERAVHDRNRLQRGRSYYRRRSVTSVEVEPGVVSALVEGSRPEPYKTCIYLRKFTEDDWRVVIEIVASQAVFLAELLSGELSAELEEALELEEVPLLPRSGEISFACNCPDWADPCKHAAALCFEFADLLETDPIYLLVLRGVERDELLKRLREVRNSTGAIDLGVGAASSSMTLEAFLVARGVGAASIEADRNLEEFGSAQPVRAYWNVTRESELPVGLGQSFSELLYMVRWAAERARRVLEFGECDDFEVSEEVGVALALAWVATEKDNSTLLTDEKYRGNTPSSLANAYEIAGDDGVRIMVESGRLTAEQRKLAKAALASVTPYGSVRVSGNRATKGNLQLRCDRNENWYLFIADNDGWELAGRPAKFPAELFGGTGLL